MSETAQKYPDRLVWLDIETTDLEPSRGVIWELGLIVTAGDLTEVARWERVLHADRESLGRVSDWSLEQHAKSGLLKAALASTLDEKAAAKEALLWLQRTTDWNLERKVPMCGASIHFDRAWLKSHMPELEAWFYYGNLDVSSVEKLAALWHPNVAPWEDRGLHRAQPDNEDSINELRYYVAQGVLATPRLTDTTSKEIPS